MGNPSCEPESWEGKQCNVCGTGTGILLWRLAIQADEFLLLDSDEYGTYFGMENDVADSEKAVCVRLMVRNDSDEAISWDDIFSVIGEGFVCRGGEVLIIRIWGLN